MKAFPVVKFLTLVTLVIFTSESSWSREQQKDSSLAASAVSASGGGAVEVQKPKPYKNQEECIKVEARKNKQVCIKIDDPTKQKACNEIAESNARESSECSDYLSVSQLESGNQKCESAFEKWQETATKEKEACTAFNKSETKDCNKRVTECKKMIKEGTSPFSLNEGKSGTDALENIALASVSQRLGIQNQQGFSLGQGACVKSIDRQSRKNDKKEKDRERKELADKIKKQKEDITKFTEELNKERDESKVKTAEIEAQNKKDNLDEEKKMREETAKISKSSIESSKRIRGITTAISQKMQKLSQVNFEFQSQMLKFTSDKVDIKCKQAVESIRASIVNSKTMNPPGPNASAEEKKNFEAASSLAAMYKSKGIKGSGELKTLLLQTRKDCYSDASTEKNRLKLANAQAVENLQSEVDEQKKQIEDEKKNLALDQQNIQNLKTESEKNKNNLETEKLDKLNNLNSKLTNLVNTTEQKIQTANEEIARLNQEIAKLALVETQDVEDAFSEADEAITKGKNARSKAQAQCDCLDDKGNDKIKNADDPRKVMCATLSSFQNDIYTKTKPKSTPSGQEKKTQ